MVSTSAYLSGTGERVEENTRYVPLIRNKTLRMFVGFLILIGSLASSALLLEKKLIGIVFFVATIAWLPSVYFTDKYVHKYPQRYFTYLLASHLKAAIIMTLFLFVVSVIVGLQMHHGIVLWTGFSLFVLADAIVSVFRRRDTTGIKTFAETPSTAGAVGINNASAVADPSGQGYSLIDSRSLVAQIPTDIDPHLVEFINRHLPGQITGNGIVSVIDDIRTEERDLPSAAVNLLIGRKRLNDVLRLNLYLQHCTDKIIKGGYFVISYMPLENLKRELAARYKGAFYWVIFIAHFIWYRAIPKIPVVEKLYFSPKLSWLDAMHLSIVKNRNRALAKAELWGRLSYWGMEVIAESEGEGEIFLIARRVADPVKNKTPSFYMIASLEKVGLDGKIVHMHKIRTMYPFSEFLQKRIFEDHGLSSTGKFANDFRLTDYGKFLRKYWLDELPQVFDWLRGDVKLVGMRATSPHYLSLYPKQLYDLYIQIKPGLIPPIFDERTTGFEQIIDIELKYLESYKERPVQTDILCLYKTFIDIFFRGIRSK